MNKRIGGAVIVIERDANVDKLNKIISEHSEIILGRQGIPLRGRELNIISLVLEGSTDDIGYL